MRRRLALPLASAVLALTASLFTATSASAAPHGQAPGPQQLDPGVREQLQLLHRARGNQGAWSSYGFDWSTDYCSSSPDNPFGFPFQNACVRHDFGYRNYKAAYTFSANKARIDSAFYADLKRVCAKYSGATKASCDALAWTYYHAVDIFGVSPMVDGSRSVV